jgi:hypothetical protein
MFALRQNASRISLHLLTWLKEMLTERERIRSGFSAGGGGFQKENTANREIAVHKAPTFRRLCAALGAFATNMSQLQL